MDKVLVIEDNVRFRGILVDSIRYAFPTLQVDEATNGEEALDKMKTIHPSFILLDIRLPDTLGLDLLPKIKAQDPSTHIAILTSYDSPEYRKRAKELGVVCFLVKGEATPEEIMKTVENYTQC